MMRSKWISIFLIASATLWAKAEIAKAVIVQGTATAAQPGEKERVLSEGSLIYLKDTLQTKVDSAIQIEFTDKSLLDLVANTRYIIKEYQYGKTLSKDKSQSELVEGGFRLLSGSIKPNPDEYNVKTPNATIGLLGTLLEATMDEGTLFVACTQGRVQIKNSEGTVVIGEGLEQYAVVTSYSRRPRIFIHPPSNMIRPTIRPGS